MVVSLNVVSIEEEKLDRKNGVKSRCEEDDPDRQKCTVVSLPNVILDIQCDETLDGTAAHEADTGQVCLPTDGCEPA